MSHTQAQYPSPPSSSPQTLILGGGVAGIAAALRLAEHGHRVVLLETSRRLGGRATSHDDPHTSQTLDNCQHVLLGCCTTLTDLYRRLGVDSAIRWHTDLYFVDRDAQVDVLCGAPLPAPLHLAPTLWQFKALGLSDKWAITRAMGAMLRISVSERGDLHEISFAQWLARHRQPRRAVERFWSVIIISALNARPEDASAAAAVQVFQEGFLAHHHAYRMGVPSLPLRELYDPAQSLIERAGGAIRFGEAVERIEFDGRRVTGVRLRGGERYTAENFVSALPFDRLSRIVPDALRQADTRLQSLARFEHSPILGVHLWFHCRDVGEAVDLPHLIFLDSPLQWLFNKGRVEHESEDQASAMLHLHGVISAADQWMQHPASRIVEMTLEEMEAHGCGLGEAVPARTRVIKEKRATFRYTPALETARPSARGGGGGGENLLLAGDWTDTGWPPTMESAARSGYAAASAILGRDLTVRELPHAPLYKVLVGRQ